MKEFSMKKRRKREEKQESSKEKQEKRAATVRIEEGKKGRKKTQERS
jgi:hypothetical protein